MTAAGGRFVRATDDAGEDARHNGASGGAGPLDSTAHRTRRPSRGDGVAAESQRLDPALLSLLPFVTMGVITLVDVTAGSGVGLLPLIAVGPAFAGLVGSWRRTATAGALALALCVGLGLYGGLLPHRRGYTAMVAVAGTTAAALLATVLRQRRERELAGVRTIAEVAQRVLLRPVPRSAGSLRMAVSYTSAVAEARIGGDLYEVVASPHGVRILIGDVQGKGLEAVETAAVVLGAFREAAYDEGDLTEVGARLDRALERHLTSEKFVTAILAEIRSEDTITLLDRGHPAPLLVRADESVELVEPLAPALPLGLALMERPEAVPYDVRFVPGDQLLFYTDGVTEARDGAGAFYPLTERAHLLDDPDPDHALRRLREDVVSYVNGPLHDDAAMLLVRHRGPAER